jgi:hypothetical protein
MEVLARDDAPVLASINTAMSAMPVDPLPCTRPQCAKRRAIAAAPEHQSA